MINFECVSHTQKELHDGAMSLLCSVPVYPLALSLVLYRAEFGVDAGELTAQREYLEAKYGRKLIYSKANKTLSIAAHARRELLDDGQAWWDSQEYPI